MVSAAAILCALALCLAALTLLVALSEPLQLSAVQLDGPHARLDLDALRVSGWALRAVSYLACAPYIGPLVATALRKNAKFLAVRELAAALGASVPPLAFPLVPSAAVQERHAKLARQDETPVRPAYVAGHIRTSFDYVRAYKSRAATPRLVMERTIAEVLRLNPLLGFPVSQMLEAEVLAQADASTARYAQNRSLGLLDGVPVLVKENLCVLRHNATAGTVFRGTQPCAWEEPGVAKLRKLGAIILGATSMHELGLGVTGNNPATGRTTRNPRSFTRYAGGSSGGAAAAVAAGLVPLAVGTDAGGSVRIPAAFTGTYGFKPTSGRVPWKERTSSLSDLGQIGASSSDVALAYKLMAGQDVRPHLSGFNRTDLAGVRACVVDEWNAEADADMRTSMVVAKMYFSNLTAVKMPNLGVFSRAHPVLLLAEFAANADGDWAAHRFEMSPETCVGLALGRSLSAVEYVAAQRVRAFASHEFKRRVFSMCDVLLTPATGSTAPVIPPASLQHGESNSRQAVHIMRYAALANLLGLPAGVVPVHHSPDNGMPVGMQILAAPFEDALVLAVMEAVQRMAGQRRQVFRDQYDVAFPKDQPQHYANLHEVLGMRTPPE